MRRGDVNTIIWEGVDDGAGLPLSAEEMMFTKESAAQLLENADVFYPADDDIPSHTLNMNDTWFWASAWGEEVEDGELVEVATLFWRYGNAGLLYWVSKKH